MGSINRGIVNGREKERAISSFESYVAMIQFSATLRTSFSQSAKLGRDKISDFAGARP